MISQQQAIEAAKKKLDEIGVTYRDRQVQVAVKNVYAVVFPCPPNVLGGDFTLLIDFDTGEVVSMKIER